MEWLTNYHDPSDKFFELSVMRMSDETQAQAVANARHWLSDKIIGQPKATEFYTVGQLKAFGIVGVYRA